MAVSESVAGKGPQTGDVWAETGRKEENVLSAWLWESHLYWVK